MSVEPRFRRDILTDQFGTPISDTNRLPVDATLVASSSTFSDYKTNDTDEDGVYLYVGQSLPDSDTWLIMKIETATDDLSITYANISNNSTITTYTAAWAIRKTTLVYSQIQDLIFSNQPGSIPTASNPLPVNIQDKTSEIIDLYVCKINGTTNPTSGINVDDKQVTVANNTGAVVGDCINIQENGHYSQSIISNVAGNIISFSSPIDYAYTTSAIVYFGEWDLATANGSVTPQIFHICPPDGVKYDIYAISISIEDNTVMYESKFGGITALTNGLIGRVTDGYTKNLFLVTNNGGFREYGFITEYPDKVPTGSYAFWGNKQISRDNGVAIRLNGTTEDKIEIIVQDDLTGLSKFAITVHGHVVTE
jgi:hypothetical protein